MGEARISLTVYFEDPFWVGVFERTENGKLSAAKVTFGAEPKDYEVHDWILRHYYDLKFSPAVEAAEKNTAKNPKKRQREITRSLQKNGTGTKSQQALQAQYEQNKLERHRKSREERLLEAENAFRLKQQKKKEKHRGR